jgi:hypothetical protein
VVWPQNYWEDLSVVCLQNHWDGFLWFGIKTGDDGFLRFGLKIGACGFSRFGLKTGDRGFSSLDLKTSIYGLVICASKSPRYFLDLFLKTKRTTVYQLHHKTDGRIKTTWGTYRDLATCFTWKQVGI